MAGRTQPCRAHKTSTWNLIKLIKMIYGVPSRERVEELKKSEAQYPKSDWSEGSYNDTMRKLADEKRKKYGTTCSYNGY